MISRSLRTTLAMAGSVLALAITAPASAATFTITIPDGGTCAGMWQTAGTAANPVISCVTDGNPPPAGAPVCTGYSTSPTVTAGNAITLTLGTCTAPAGGANTFKWSVGGTPIPLATSSTLLTPPLSANTTYIGTVTGSDGQFTTISIPITVTTTPPPTTSNCSRYNAINLGDVPLSGAHMVSGGMSGSAVAYGRIVVPNPLPAGWLGKTGQISVFTYSEGSYWRKVYLSKTACDFTGTLSAWGQGIGVNLYMNFGGTGYNAVTMQPGDIWYINVKNESFYGTASCAAGHSCNFGLRTYPPGT